MALSTISRDLGYAVSDPTLDFAGPSVHLLSNDKEEFHALIQTRSYIDTGYRYWIGIVIPDLRKVDQFIGWFKREPKLVKVPASLLCTILDEREALGDATYADGGRQWNVNFHLDEGTLSQVGSRGKHTTSLSTSSRCDLLRSEYLSRRRLTLVVLAHTQTDRRVAPVDGRARPEASRDQTLCRGVVQWGNWCRFIFWAVFVEK